MTNQTDGPDGQSPTKATSSTNNASGSAKYHVPALELALDVIEELAASPYPRSISEIATVVEKSPGSLFRIMATLERRGYITKDNAAGHYAISLRLLQLAHRTAPIKRLVPVAGPLMDRLSSEVGQSCHLSVRDGSHMLVIHEASGPQPIRLMIDVGSRQHILDTLSGRVVLAGMSAALRDQVIERDDILSSMSKHARSSLEAELDNIRTQGFGTRHGGFHAGVDDVAAPIGKLADGPVAALTVTSLQPVGQPLEVDKISTTLLETVRAINAALGEIDAVDRDSKPRVD